MTSHISVGLIVLSVLVLGAATPGRTATVEGGPLRVSVAGDGSVDGVSAAGTNVLNADAQAASGFAVRDFAGGEEYVPLRGAATQADAGLNFVVGADTVKAEVTAELKPWQDTLEVSGVLRSQAPPPRSLTVRFALPVDLAGWSWHRDLSRTLTVNDLADFSNAVPCKWGAGLMDLWPLAAVSDDRSTLCVATRVDEPRLFRIQYLGEQGLLTISFDFGLSEHSQKFATEAPFHFFIYALDRPTGVRGALERYYHLFPELFVERTRQVGGWFAWGDIARQPAPLCDFGLMFHEQPESEDGLAHDTELGLVPMPYIEPSMYQLHFGDQEDKPTREQILDRLRTYADPATTGRIWSNKPCTTPEQEELKRRLCEAVLKSGVRDAQGELVINSVGQYHWVAGSRWAAQLGCVLDPDIPGGRGEYLLEHARKNVLDKPRMKGAYLDSYQAHMGSASFAPEQIAAADIPPIFAGDPPQPCVTVAFGGFEYVEALRKLIGEERVILPNLYNFRYPIPFHQFDVLGKEHWVAPAGWLMQSFRALGEHKVVTQLPAYEDATTDFLRQMLLYDVFPGGYARHTGDPPIGMRADYRTLIPWLRVLHRLGWEPVTEVTATQKDIRIERYGKAPGPVALVLYSPYVGRKAHVTLDAARIGVPPDAWCVDPLDEEPLSWQRDGELLTVEAAVRAGNVRLVVVGNTQQQARVQLMMAEDRVDDAAFCLREWQMRQGQEHPAKANFDKRPAPVEPGWIEETRATMTGDEPSLARGRELMDLGLAHLQAAETMAPAKPQPVPEPPRGGVVLALPFEENFDKPLDTARWEFKADDPGIRLKDGKLELEIARGRGAGIMLKPLLDFSAKPRQLDWDFQYNHSGGWYYLMLTFCLQPPAEGSGDIFRIRIDPGISMRIENGETAPSGYRVSLTPYTKYKTNVPHHMTLQIGPEQYALWIDGELHGRGEHRLGFTHGQFTAGVYSGHGGFGDVCWMDNLKMKEIGELTETPQ